VPDRKDPELVELMETMVRQGAPARRDSDRPARFAVGDRVRVVDDSPFGHTRRARYIRGRQGVITKAHGTFIYPDSAGNGRGDDPQHVYTVLFRAPDLWGEQVADPNGTVTFDVWEPYLETA
jgi:nitrile hydratase